MRQRISVLLALVAVLVAASLSACATVNPAQTQLAERGLPLRVAWMKSLVQQGREDIWRPMQYAAPTVDKGTVFLGDNDGRVMAFDATDGALLWEFKTFGGVESAPWVNENVVIAGDGDGYVYCLDRRTGFVKWTYRVQGQVMGRVISDGKLVFVRTNHERLYAVTLADGKWKWMQSRELPTGFTIRGVSSPVLDGDRVLLGFADGSFFAFRTDDGSEVFKTLLEKGERFVDVDTTPLVHNDRILVAGSNGSVYCLSRDNAAIQWTFGRGSVRRAAIVDGTVFISDDQGVVHGLDLTTGEEKWQFDVRENDLKNAIAGGARRRLKAPTNPVPFGDVLLVASSSGYFYALDQKTGDLTWKFWPGFGVTSEIVTDDGAVYVHTNYGNLYCLRANHAIR